jgi:putative copper resistance protein D
MQPPGSSRSSVLDWSSKRCEPFQPSERSALGGYLFIRMGRHESARTPDPVAPRHVIRALILLGAITAVLAALSQISNFGLKPIPKVPRFSLGVDWLSIAAVGATAYCLMLFFGRSRIPGRARRGAAFLAGLAAMLVAFVSPLDAYVNHSLFAHMAQHVLLLFVVAPLIALGTPITVLMETLPLGWRCQARSWLLGSHELAVLTHPVVPAFLFAAVQFLMLTPVFEQSFNTGSRHSFTHGLYLVAGFLFWWPVLGVDLTPRPTSVRLRSVALALGLLSTVAFAAVILWADAPLFAHYASLPLPWGGRGALISQQKAGALLLGAAVAVAVAAVVAMRGRRFRHRVASSS